MKVWITKYCLTSGILEKEVEISSVSNDMVVVVNSSHIFSHESYHGEGKDWHTTKESAVNKANEMKQKKINSIKNQLKKLENLSFD